jgi:PAS domain S-box-containing protein
MISKKKSISSHGLVDESVGQAEFLEALINYSPDILYIYDLIEKKNVYSNDGINNVLGYSAKEIQDMGSTLIPTLMHPDDICTYIEKTIPSYSLLADNEPIIHQYRMKHRDGSWHFLESTELIYRRREDQSPWQIFGVIHDITKQRQAEILLHESERFLKESQEIAHIGHWNWDVQKGELVWSDEIFRIFGVTRETFPISAESFDRTIHPDDFPAFAQARQKMLDCLDTLSVEHRIILPNSEIRHVHERAHVIRDKDNNVMRVFGTVQDITERKQTDELKAQLELQIQQTKKLESLGVLAGGIAHDFNNLMGGIFGYIDLAMAETKEDTVTSYLSKAITTIDRARALTQQLLTFAKGGAPIQAIAHLFPFIQETAKFALSGSNVLCQFNVPQDLWPCNFDKNQIGQVIDNIIINAQQAMPVGGTIVLSARNITLEENEHPILLKGNYVKISIKDCGIGIQKELLNRIFDPFFTTKAKGHGLGLATCYSIINRHGGCIDVESEQGKGSTFIVCLPASQEAALVAIKPTDKTHKGSGTFLIMDDEKVMLETIGDMLASLGYTVVGKENGKDAVDFFVGEIKGNRKLSGMVFDLTVPGGMGGKAAVEKIRKLDSAIPVFVASGYAEDPVMKNPVEFGFTASICKPFRISELVEMLNKYMQPMK